MPEFDGGLFDGGLFDGIASPGDGPITVPLIASEEHVFTPSVMGAIIVPFISSTATVYTPTVIGPDQTLTIPFISSTAQVFTPLVVGPDQTIVLSLVPSTARVFAPSVSNAGAPFSPLKIYLDGVEYPDVKFGMVSFTRRLNGQGSASFDLNWRTQTTRPELFQYVEIKENYRLEFTGFIDTIDESRDQNTIQTFHVTASDRASILDKRTVKGAKYAVGPVATIVRQIVSDWLDGEGLTDSFVTATASTTREFSFTGSVSSALNDLATDTGSVWYVDDLGQVHFETPGVTSPAAPQSITDTSDNYVNMVVSTSSRGYANAAIGVSDQNLG